MVASFLTPSSSRNTTSSGTPSPATPSQHHAGHGPPLLLLLIIIIVLVPLSFMGTFLLYRRYCPGHYAKTDKYCPFRATARWIANLPFVAAWRARRERNKGIRDRQREYMYRRKNTWDGNDKTTSKKSEEQTAAERDEWLRQDMIEHYRGTSRSGNIGDVPLKDIESKQVPNVPLLSPTGSAPPAYRSSVETAGPSTPLRPMHSKPSLNALEHVPAPSNSLAAGPTSPGAQQSTPGILTGGHIRGPANIPISPTNPDHTQKPTLRDMIRAQREKLLREEAAARSESSFGSYSNQNTKVSEAHIQNGSGNDNGNEVWTDVHLGDASGEAGPSRRGGGWDDGMERYAHVPPVPPKSPDRFR
ncbi:hypothetical protein LTR64_007682 [Lithohypha guttulata]|uniref:uncharacterized protein n=1 Tax=Lithohypha guttulata TaxID=1690604 RepID=UPI002DE02AB2|nr:hypothetical protein LTR51_007191 [Lithohypha guttulata]